MATKDGDGRSDGEGASSLSSLDNYFRRVGQGKDRIWGGGGGGGGGSGGGSNSGGAKPGSLKTTSTLPPHPIIKAGAGHATSSSASYSQPSLQSYSSSLEYSSAGAAAAASGGSSSSSSAAAGASSITGSAFITSSNSSSNSSSNRDAATGGRSYGSDGGDKAGGSADQLPITSSLGAGTSSNSGSSSSSSGAAAGATGAARDGDSVPQMSYREKKFEKILAADVVQMDELKQLSWNGVPSQYRPMVWKLLLGYLPANADRRVPTLNRKRKEYLDSIPSYFDVPDASRTLQEQDILVQILKDVPRTNPDVPLFHQEPIQRSMERVLYIFAIRHPANGYAQGMDGLITPLYVAFLGEYVSENVESCDVAKIPPALLAEVEADIYWCLVSLLEDIQDHYTNMQQGLYRMILRLEELVHRIDADLYQHLADQGLKFRDFAFRWMNCLLIRELPLVGIIRAWDTYFAEENGFESFHIYMCATLLCRFSAQLKEMDHEHLYKFLQNVPTKEWGEHEIEPLLSQAYILSTLFEHSPSHLTTVSPDEDYAM